MTPYSAEVELAMVTFFLSLREKDRRRYAAVEAAKLGQGGVPYIARLLGIDPKTIRQGLADLQDLPDVPPDESRKKGGGRKKKIHENPEIVNCFHQVLENRTAGSPMEELIWTDLTVADIVAELAGLDIRVGHSIVADLLKEEGFHRRQAQKSCAMGDNPFRNDQFEIIAQLKDEWLASPNPIISIDTKKREHIGNFYRKGSLYTRQTIATFDHDFPSFAEGVIIPHGIYDLKTKCGYVHLGTSRDTSEFACDCLENWWRGFARIQYPIAQSILILCDGGGSNSSRTNLFKADLQALVNRIKIGVRVAHYPPYTSKYNPIEHRLFPHLTRACQGVIFKSVELVKALMEKAKTKTGLRVVVDVLAKVYATGRKVAAEVVDAINIVRDDFLPQWNYQILPTT